MFGDLLKGLLGKDRPVINNGDVRDLPITVPPATLNVSMSVGSDGARQRYAGGLHPSEGVSSQPGSQFTNVNCDRFYAVGLMAPYGGSFATANEPGGLFDSMELSVRDRAIVREVFYEPDGQARLGDLNGAARGAFQAVYLNNDIAEATAPEVFALLKKSLSKTDYPPATQLARELPS